ncbi:MAG: hypothetical protein FD171_1560 [Actinobacteria bacterium]|nr:MAG: hypothetical protein FD171_1560 [Actinomycetota bacterium]
MTNPTGPHREALSSSVLPPAGAVFAALVLLGYWVGTGSWILVAVATLAIAVALSAGGNQLLGFALLGVVSLFDEYAYGVIDPGSTFLLRRYYVPYTTLVADEFLVYLMAALLLVQVFRGRQLKSPGRVVSRGVCVLFAVYAFQVLRAISDGYGFWDIAQVQSGKYLLLLCIALPLFVQLLDSSRVRLWVLDLLYLFGGGRAIFALLRFFVGNGDPANAYRGQVAKVALWDSADHLLYTVLIVVALSALVQGGLSGRRLVIWLCACVPAGLVVALSYRREGWLGLLMSVSLLGLITWSRGGKSILAGAGLAAFAGSVISYARFSLGGNLFERIFPDAVAGGGATRLTEGAFAWATISQQPLIGGGLLAERLGGVFFWTTQIVHSGALFVWMKMGIFGLTALFVIILGAYGSGVRAAHHGGDERYLAVALVSTLPFILLEMGFSTPLLQIRITLIWALILALMCVLGGQAGSREEAHVGL